MKVAELLKKLLREEALETGGEEGSTAIHDPEVIKQFVSNPLNTFLISFPRTGSHWLRVLMERYFERPSLVRVFYYPESTDYLTYHTHDLNLDIEHPTVLYLYREPVDTIYSQLSYHKEPLDAVDRIIYWSDLYGRHLDKWLHRERFTTKKTILRYEGFQHDMQAEFTKVTRHFGVELDAEKLSQAAAATTKQEIKRKTTHDKQVINLKADYENHRREFYRRQSPAIWDALLRNRPHLRDDFQAGP